MTEQEYLQKLRAQLRPMSHRNLAKPYRQPRLLADGSPHPLDMMKIHRQGKGGAIESYRVNTTGTFGTKQTYGERFDWVVRSGAPGKRRGGRKKKNTSHLFHGNANQIIQKRSLEEMATFRGQLDSLRIINGGLPPRLQEVMFRVTRFIQTNYPDEVKSMFDKDLQRERSLTGMVKVGTIQGRQTLNNLRNKVERAIRVLHIFGC